MFPLNVIKLSEIVAPSSDDGASFIVSSTSHFLAINGILCCQFDSATHVTYALRWSDRHDPTGNRYKKIFFGWRCSQLVMAAYQTCEIRFFHGASAAQFPQVWFKFTGSSTPMSKLFKFIEFQADNVFASSAQCTEAAEKNKTMMIRRSLQYLSLHRAFSVSPTLIGYASMFTKPRGGYEQFWAKPKIS